MIAVGQFSDLKVKTRTARGVLLGDAAGEVLLPARHAPLDLELGQTLRVFVYTDPEGGLIATTQVPRAVVGEFACLTVVDVTPQGAFLDWGLDKDLFVPLSQQHQPMRKGTRHVVHPFVDERTGRIAAASKLGPYFDYDLTPLTLGQEVKLLVYGFSELGTQVVVEGRHGGLIYASDTFQRLEIGDQRAGYIKAIRDDNKLDIRLGRVGKEAARDAAQVLLQALEGREAPLPLTDDSSPTEIYDTLGISKKAFKKAVGNLYKARRIAFDTRGIWLVSRPGTQGPK